jgi:undecaprenyl diphosphate synthase
MAEGATQNLNTVPRHVAIIMDGNGRWAKARGFNRLQGHAQGVKSVLASIKTAASLGVRYLTLYTFSTENWNRSADEVDGLMKLLISAISQYTPMMLEEGVKLKFIGDRDGLSPEVNASMLDIEMKTAGNSKITVMPALNYGGRQELTSAFKKIAQGVSSGALSIDQIDDQLISQNLYTAGIPDPDFLIRTSGELRLSNFLLWQLSYAEFYVTDTYWPDFGEEDFRLAINSYQKRGRRFGGTINVEV